MHRLFVGIRPPAPVRAQLLGLMGGVSGARWQSDDQLHLTLRFIGEVDRRTADDVASGLAAIRHAPFEIAVSGIGTFSRRGQPEVVWAGVTGREQLTALHRKVDQACVRAGLQPERRAYSPHITLARLKRGAGPVGHMLEQSGGWSGTPFTVDTFALFESALTPDGAVYTIVDRYKLG